MTLDQALLDPTSVFSRPEDVVREVDLSRLDKIRILKRWEYDARELEVADEENMGGRSARPVAPRSAGPPRVTRGDRPGTGATDQAGGVARKPGPSGGNQFNATFPRWRLSENRSRVEE